MVDERVRAMREGFVASEGADKLPGRPSTDETFPAVHSARARTRGRRKTPAETIEANENAYRAGRKDERIDNMIEAHGAAWCEWERLLEHFDLDPPEGEPHECDRTFDAGHAHSGLDYAHAYPRAHNQGYRPRKGGQNDRWFFLLCRRHHKLFDGSEPQWSG